MSDRRVYHVRLNERNGWHVIREGFHRPHLVGETKEEAILLAKRLAKASSPGQVIIHGSDDLVERRFSYGLVELDTA